MTLPPPTLTQTRASVHLPLLILSPLLTMGTAWADCPSPYTGLSCESVCSVDSAHDFIMCDLTVNGTRDSTDGLAFAVASTRLCGTGYDYCAWGNDADGTDFCCLLTVEGDETFFSILGGSYDDHISYWYSSYNMNNHGGVATFEGRVYGRSGVDVIEGSRVTGTSYTDRLNGDGGDDTIYGLAGNDYITGGDQDDTIYGGQDADTIEGNVGYDSLAGNAGNDTIFGGTQTDYISGGDGQDILHGDDDDDIVCGDEQNDGTITGDGGDDVLWGGGGTDNAQGGLGYDTCDAETGSCEATIGGGTRPGLCPDAAEP